MEIPTIALIVIACALTVFIIVVLIRLAALIGEAEKTLVIINKRLPAELDAVHSLVEHAESSLTELDKLMVSIQEPVDKFRALGQMERGLLVLAVALLSLSAALKATCQGLLPVFSRVLSLLCLESYSKEAKNEDSRSLWRDNK
jgi:hypothetical protein